MFRIIFSIFAGLIWIGCSSDPAPVKTDAAEQSAQPSQVVPQVTSLFHEIEAVEISGIAGSLLKNPDTPTNILSDYLVPSDDPSGAHPLRVKLKQAYRPFVLGTEHRYGIYAPAGSTLQYKLTPRSDSVLETGGGLLPVIDPGGGKDNDLVYFEVLVERTGGEQVVLASRSTGGAAGRRTLWHDIRVPLGRFAGEEVTLKFVTRGRELEWPLTEEMAKLPDGRMVWSEPRISSASTGGKTVLLVVLDTVSAEYVAPFSASKAELTPNLNQLSKSSSVFYNAYAPSGWTLTAFASIFTGLSPYVHRAGELLPGKGIGKLPLSKQQTSIPEVLDRKSWVSTAWINNPYLTDPFGLGQGFHRYIDYGRRTMRNASAQAVDELVSYLSEPVGYNRFIFFHFMDPHGPYAPTTGQLKRYLTDECPSVEIQGQKDFELYRNIIMGKTKLTPEEQKCYRLLYDALLNYTDRQFGRVVEAFKALPNGHDNLLILTADHGEEFWQHGRYEHAHSLYDELLKVPLIVNGDGIETRAIKERVSLMDVYPTIMEFAKTEEQSKQANDRVTGSSLYPLMQKGKEGGYRTQDLLANGVLYGIERFAYLSGDWKYIYNARRPLRRYSRAGDPGTRHELYNLKEDSEEKSNKFKQVSDVGKGLYSKLVRELVKRKDGRLWAIVKQPKEGQPGRFDLKVKNGESPGKIKHRWVEFQAPLANGSDGRLQSMHFPKQGQIVVDSDSTLTVYRVDIDGEWTDLECSYQIWEFEESSFVTGSGQKEVKDGAKTEYSRAALVGMEEKMIEDALEANVGDKPEVFLWYSEDSGVIEALDLDSEVESELEKDLHSLGYIG